MFSNGLDTIEEDALYEPRAKTRIGRDRYTSGNDDRIRESGSDTKSESDKKSDKKSDTKSDTKSESESDTVKRISVERFERRLAGWGMVVRKRSKKGGIFGFRRLSYMGKHLQIQSLAGSKLIGIDRIHSCMTSGKDLTLETLDFGRITLVMPTISDAIAFKNVLG
jgi:hypothetical protein